MKLNLNKVRVESLLPAKAAAGDLDAFFENSMVINEQMAQRFQAAQEMGMVLRYVARFDATKKRAKVTVDAVLPDHPLAALLPGDNVFALKSLWYGDNPLIIRGLVLDVM
ncbi:Bifunctional aspartokinase/homoserine dehydrogenase 2 [Arsenophonus endosymbiont of Bemisia tabaci Q2]|nr:Bifunctional aspartokinase/homoserine dehydrogenase 2 [Arsenophonus endosymbiont of Bemisia tabaci Q2]